MLGAFVQAEDAVLALCRLATNGSFGQRSQRLLLRLCAERGCAVCVSRQLLRLLYAEVSSPSASAETLAAAAEAESGGTARSAGSASPRRQSAAAVNRWVGSAGEWGFLAVSSEEAARLSLSRKGGENACRL